MGAAPNNAAEEGFRLEVRIKRGSSRTGKSRMPVTTATAADLPVVKVLVRVAARSQVGLGDEDLAMLVEAGNVLLASAAEATRPLQRHQIDALAAFYPEPRPVSLPTTEPDRVFLRAAAFRNGVSPSATLHELLDAWCSLPGDRT